jgi:hypothetical protein
MKTIKEMRNEIAEKYSAIPEKQVTVGIYLKSVGAKWVTLLNTWGVTHTNKIEISEFYENYIS